jgi:hypothetical protein
MLAAMDVSLPPHQLFATGQKQVQTLPGGAEVITASHLMPNECVELPSGMGSPGPPHAVGVLIGSIGIFAQPLPAMTNTLGASLYGGWLMPCPGGP